MALTLALTPSLGVLRLLDAAPVVASGESRAAGAGLYGGERIAPLALEATSIGRGPQNDVVLLDPAVSREHARLLLQRDGWWIENVSTRNPLWVDGREIAHGVGAPVSPGARLTLGHTSLQLLAPLLARGADDGSARQPATGITLAGASATGILSPGVTLQFAFKGRVSAWMGWALAAVAALIFLASAIITLGTLALVGRNAATASGLGHVLASLAIPLAPALGVAVAVGFLDRYEREPPPLLLGAFLWGAVIAIPPVLFIERGLATVAPAGLRAPGLGGALTRAVALALNAGLTEEVVKGAGLLLLLWVLRDEFDNVTDGAIYGALIGAGFAMVENYVYFAVSLRGDLGFLIFGRVVLGWLSHSTFTACFGIGLGYAREAGRRGHRLWLPPVLGLGAAVLLHTFFNVVAFGADALAANGVSVAAAAMLALGALLAEYVPLFAAELVLLRLVLAALEREAAVVREYLAGEVIAGVLTPDEYALLQNASLRAEAEHHYALTYGPRAYLTARALYQTATGLAFRKWHVAQGDPPKPTPRQPEDAYRARIARLRRSLLRQVRLGPRRRAQVSHPLGSGQSAIPTRPLE